MRCFCHAFLVVFKKKLQMALRFVVMAGIAVYGAFTKDLSLWPSEGWRWAGILLNGIGMIAGVGGIIQITTKKATL